MEVKVRVLELAQRARRASRTVAALSGDRRARALRAMAGGIEASVHAIITANEADLQAARGAGLSGALLDRLALDDARLRGIVEAVSAVADQPDPLGRTLSEYLHPDGMVIRKVSVPLGVVAVIYESRPNVTADAAAVAFSAGNAVILRGGSEAVQTNRALLHAMLEGADGAVPADAVQLIDIGGADGRAAVREIVQLEGLIELVIPRGGEGLIRTVAEHARVPVLKHYKGVCHVYVDRAAELEMAREIIINAKCQRPGVCNAAETLLVHEDIAERFLPDAARALIEHGVELRGDEQVRRIAAEVTPATEGDWKAEYLDLILAVRIVPDLDAAVDHIERYGSHHSDVIVTGDPQAAERFTRDVDSAAVYVNASSRFTDGGEFGLGAEIGISTDKLHARGPCGIEALTTYKYIIHGNGQVRT